MTYTPQPGTIAHRVIAHLQTVDPDVELSSQVLLEAIGQPSDWHGLSQCLESAVFHGFVHKRLEGRKAFWKIGGQTVGQGAGIHIDRAQAPLEDHTAVDDPEPNSRPRVATAAETVLRKARDAGLPKAPTCTESQTEPETANAPACEFALTNSGRLLIDTGAQQLALTKDQADELMAYLDKARGLEWEGA